MKRPEAEPNPETELRIAALERYWAEGAASLRTYPGRMPYKCGLSSSEKTTLCLKRWFADPKRGYSPGKLRDLVQLCRQHGYCPGTATVGKIIGAPPSRDRDRLMLDAIKGRWSWTRVKTELKMRKLTVKRPGQGRTVSSPVDVADVQRRITVIIPSALAQLSAIMPDKGQPQITLPDPIAKEIKATKKHLENVLWLSRLLTDCS